MKTTLLFSFILSSLFALGQAIVIPDSTFNGTGRSVFSVGASLDFGDNIALQPDGKIIMTGASMNLGGLVNLGVCRLNPDGSFDNTFGTGGVSQVDLGGQPSQGGFDPEIFIQPDGKILICGYGWNGTDEDMFICRLLPGGALDPGFGTGGKVFVGLMSAGMPDAANAITIDASGNIYACGSTRIGATPMSNDLAIIKLTPSGNPDPSFSGDGKLLLDISTGLWDFGYGITVKDDGKIIVAGYTGFPADFFAIRLLPDGNFDTSFGTSGKTIIDIMGSNVADECLGMTIANNGNILLAGNGYNPATNSFVGAVVCLTPAGIPDVNFGNNGVATLAVSPELTTFYNVMEQPDGKIIASGNSTIGGNNDFIVARFNADGTPDLSFNNNGHYTIDPTGQAKSDIGYGLALQSDGRILLSGNTSISEFTNEKYSVVRLKAKEVDASFSSSSTLVCAGQTVQFINSTFGNNLSFFWTFEGGTPSTSTLQNPSVTYSSTGLFDVKLVATNGTVYDSITRIDYIHVIDTPVAPQTPSGITAACQGQTYTYTTAAVNYANSYFWAVTPSSAGNISGNGLSATFTASPGYIGAYGIKVSAVGICGSSSWSGELDCVLNDMPGIFNLEGEGSFCEGNTSATLTLSGSEIGVDYQLFLDSTPYSSLIPGTGSALEWDNITTQGFYTVTAITMSCSQQMAGQIYVSMINAPGQPGIPAGNNNVCNNSTSVYNIDEVLYASSYNWILTPPEAGILTANGPEVNIAWASNYSGDANLNVSASNNCGLSALSETFIIFVNDAPEPEISGPETVCLNWNVDYETIENYGSTYLWTVTGGEILSGAGTAFVVVKWNSSGTGTLIVNETNETGCSETSELFTVLVDPCVNVDLVSLPNTLIVHPNPAQSTLTVKLNEIPGKNSLIKLLDVTGRTILTLELSPNSNEELQIDVSSLASGYYSLIYLKEGRIASQNKVIKK